MINDLDGSVGSRYFLDVACERKDMFFIVRVITCLECTALLTEMLPMFLSRLNAINRGYQKIPVLGSF